MAAVITERIGAFMGFVTFLALILFLAILVLVFGIAYWKSCRRYSCIIKKVKAHVPTIRITEDRYDAMKIKEIEIMLSNYGYSPSIVETNSLGSVVHVYERTF